MRFGKDKRRKQVQCSASQKDNNTSSVFWHTKNMVFKIKKTLITKQIQNKIGITKLDLYAVDPFHFKKAFKVLLNNFKLKALNKRPLKRRYILSDHSSLVSQKFPPSLSSSSSNRLLTLGSLSSTETVKLVVWKLWWRGGTCWKKTFQSWTSKRTTPCLYSWLLVRTGGACWCHFSCLNMTAVDHFLKGFVLLNKLKAQTTNYF